MSKLSSFPPFSPAKGKVTVDPAFEFEAPRFCDLQDDNYDFYDDYEKNIWFEETHWLHEPPEKRPHSDRAKRKSIIPSNLAAAAAVAKRQLTAIMGEGSPDMARLKRVTTTRGEDESGTSKAEDARGRSGSFERDANFSPSRVFAAISDNVEPDAVRRARSGAKNSPLKLRGPERILFRDSDKENFETEDLEDLENKAVKGRKSSSRISDGKAKENIGEGGSRDSTGKEEREKEKAKVSLEGKGIVKSRKSGDGAKEARGSLGDGKSVDVKTRKSGEGKAPVSTIARRKSTVRDLKEEDKEKAGRNSGGGTIKPTKKADPPKTEETEAQKKIKARKSISMSSIAYINANSTTYSIPIKSSHNPTYPPSTSTASQPPLQKTKSDISLPLSTLPFLDIPKGITSLPTRVQPDEYQETEQEEIEATVEVREEGEGEVKRKRKSAEALVSEKPKRTRSSIMTCPVPAKKKVAPVEKPAPAPAPSKDKKTIIKTKRKSFEFELDDDVAAILEKHNKKFKPVASYVPRNFPIKDVKMWEEYSGKKWYSLSAAEREEANEWIKQAKAQM